jgi:Tol biopolymer transport system component
MIAEGLMAGISEPANTAITSVDVERGGGIISTATSRFAWLSVGIAVWIVGGFFFLLWAVVHGLTGDPALSVYVIPLYSGLAVLGAAAAALAVRASRQGRSWRRAFPPGYGVLVAGVTAVVAGFVADVGWREGVGQPQGVEGLLAPTRLLMVAGLVLVAVAPLRLALRQTGTGAPRWPAVLSASLVLAAMYLPGGFHPVLRPWPERGPVPANAEIWLMDRDGAHQTRLIEAHDGIIAWNAVWSPDGKRLAYTRLLVGDRPPVDIPDEADIWVAEADGTNAHALVERADWQWLPHWSPDGMWVVYTDEPESGPWASTGPAGLGGGGFLGTGIGFGSSNPVRSYADIWRVRADGTGSPERLTDEPGDDRAATYSPDGTSLAFDSTRGGGTDIFVMKADGSDAHQLTFTHGQAWGATWSPDGRIAFNAWHPGGGNEDIYVIGPGGEKRLTTDPADDVEPSWSPDGTRIVYRRLDGSPDGGRLLSIASDGSDEQEMSREPGAGFDLTSGGGVWAADGRIVFGRGENPPANANPLVRDDLGSASMLLTAIVLAFMAVLLARIRPPFGAFAFLVAGPIAVFAVIADQWRFIPGAVVAGLVVDVLVRFAPERWKIAVAGSGSAAACVLSAEVTVAVTSNLGWSATLLVGVLVASAAIGWGIGLAVGPTAREAEIRS